MLLKSNNFISEKRVKAYIFGLLREALVGQASSPPIVDLLVYFGRKESLKRIDRFLSFLNKLGG